MESSTSPNYSLEIMYTFYVYVCTFIPGIKNGESSCNDTSVEDCVKGVFQTN